MRKAFNKCEIIIYLYKLLGYMFQFKHFLAFLKPSVIEKSSKIIYK